MDYASGAKQQAAKIDGNTKPRLKVVRQDRKNVEDLNCTLEIGGAVLKVVNISPFGVLVESEKEFESKEIIATFVANNIEIGIFTLRLVRSRQNEVGKYLHALETIGEPIGMDRIAAVDDAGAMIKTHDQYLNQSKRIPDSFARKVYEVKDWLEDLQSKISTFESKVANLDKSSVGEYENTFVQVVGDYLNMVMPIKNKDLGEIIKDYNSEVIKLCYEFFRDKLKNLIYQAPFSDRVFHKPRGYAGDYEMMNIIYRSIGEGETLFAKCLHHYWVNQPAAQAVRNRAIYMGGKILDLITAAKNDVRVLSVACGPAMEWQNILKSNKNSNVEVNVDLLDQDEEALKHAQRKLKETQMLGPTSFNFEFLHMAIKHILVRGLVNKYDLIYSAGLFDYFSDPVAQLACAKLYESLNPGGRIIIGNFNVDNPNSIVMDLALDWNLIYRSPQDLMRLFECVGGEITIEYEPLNINLFCIITKK